MSLSKLAQNQKPTAVPAPAPVEAPSTPADAQALSLFDGGGTVTVADALNAALTAGDSNSAASVFPVVTVTAGAQGGQFAPADFLPQELQDILPSGKKPITAVFMGYRLAVSAWAVGYNDAAAAKPASPPKPVYAASVSPNDADGLALAMKAAKNCQFTKSADKGKFDYASSKAGHVKVQVELLAYLPETNGVVILAAPTGYGSTEATLQSLLKLVDPATKGLGQFPGTFRAVSEEKKSKSGFSWTQHSIDVSTAVTTAGQQVFQQYTTWRQAALQDPGLVASVREWLAAQDRRMTADIKAALVAAASL